ncbi:MAG TPA: hypothetical protein VKY92_10255 [Verrucomicrobiae bacterium]|nr:hypothetical protein [Verrucomicrobiae bacterium]
MKNTFLILLSCVTTATTALAQVPESQPPQSPSYQGQVPQNYSYNGNVVRNQQAAGGVMFTNSSGQTFTANDLALQLQNLRSAVDQAIPVLSAFNENYSNSVGGGRQTVGGALSGIVSDVLHRNQQTSGANQSSSFSGTNLLAILHGLLNTNAASSTMGAPANAEDLRTLETDLQPVASILQRMNVSPAANSFGTQNPYNNPSLPSRNQSLSPTGR